MIQRIESIEQDLRQWGQRQALVLDHDSITALRTLCDRLRDIRADMRRENPAAEPDAFCPASDAGCHERG